MTTREKPSATLASADDQRPVADHTPQVTVSAATVGPWPALRATRAVAPAVVVALVAGALLIGFLLGWAVGRMGAG